MTRERFRQLFESAVPLHQAGNLDGAEVIYKKVLEEFPDNPDALHLLGVIAHQRGRHHEALGLLLHAIDQHPKSSDYFGNLGAVWNALGSYSAAAEAFRECLKLDPKNAGVYVSLARALSRSGDYPGAAAASRAAVEINPNLADAHRELGVDLNSLGELDQAVAEYHEALRLNPKDAQTHSNLIFAMETQEGIDQKSILAELKEWNRVHAEPVKHLIKPHQPKRPENPPKNSPKTRKLRIGWVSGDFRRHVVARCMLPVFKEFDRAEFENYCYSNVVHADPTTYAVRRSVDHWREIFPLSDEKAADLIRADGIDVLVDLALHSGLTSLPVFALKPAPVQVCYLGYCGSTGLDTMDYRISHPHLDPPGADLSGYTEKTLFLSSSYLCYRPEPEIPQVSPLPALKSGFVTFGCLNSAFKVSSGTVDLWTRILTALPASRLIVYAPSIRLQQRILDHFQNAAVDPNRVEFLPHQTWQEYIASYHRIDIALDTFPYGAGMTACDSLMMGVPMITLRGDRPVGRLCSSILLNIEHSELIADTPGGYVDIAIKMASDLASLSTIRSGLRAALERSAVMNAGGVAKELQHIFRNISHKNQCVL